VSNRVGNVADPRTYCRQVRRSPWHRLIRIAWGPGANPLGNFATFFGKQYCASDNALVAADMLLADTLSPP